MPAIILPDRWKRQPTYPVEVEKNEITVGLAAAFLPQGGLLVDVLGTVPSAQSGNPRHFSAGRAIAYSGGAYTQFPYERRHTLGDGNGITIAALLDVNSLTNYSGLAACQQSSTASGWEFRLGSGATSGELLLHRADASNNYTQTSGAAGTVVAGDKNAFVAVSASYDLNEAGYYLTRQGDWSALAGTLNPSYTMSPSSSGPLWVGRRYDNGTYLDGNIYNLLLFNAKKSGGEVRALKNAPYAVYRKKRTTLYFVSAGGGGATGTLAATESGSDTAALTGDVLIDGALAATESGSDTAALTGDVIVQGALAVTESGTDTAAATGLVLVQGALAATESGSDTAALAGLVLVQGSIASVEPGADTASIAGDVLVSGALAASETGSDTAAFTGDASLGIFGSIDAAESGSDSAQVTGLVLIQGGLAVTETGSDTAAITGPAAVSGSIAATETGSDTAAVTGLVLIYGSLATTETGSDTAAVSSFRPTVPGIEYTLPEGKAHYTLPDGRAHYTIAA